MILQTRFKEVGGGVGVKEIKQTGLPIDPFLEPIDLLLEDGQYDVAYRLLKILRPWQGEKSWVEERLNTLYRKWIPRWHFEMLNDANRGQAFADALGAVDLRDKNVLDVGTGSGLLAMLAVRHGARHVYACEMVKPLAEMAVEIVRRNGIADKITIIPKSSFQIEIGKDMPMRADVMLSETIDCGFVGEGFLPSLRHARKHLLQPNALLMPCSAELRGCLIDSTDIYNLNHAYQSQGFDVSWMNEFSTRGYFGVRLRNRPHQLMSEVKSLIDIDLYMPIQEHSTRVVGFQVAQDGVVHGVAFWFKVTLAPGIELSNDPDQMDCHWSQAFASFPQPIAVQKGEYYSVELAFEDHGVSFTPLKEAQHRSVAPGIGRHTASDRDCRVTPAATFALPS